MEEDVRDVAEVARGDRGALARLYERHAPRMLAIGERIVGDRREAEDLLHDVFVEVWRHAGDYDPERASVKAWLYLRMRSRCLDRVRSAAWARTRTQAEDPRREAQAPPSNGKGSEGSTVRRALSELPQEQRAVLLLGYYEGLSSAEIAERLELPVGTVKSRVAAAMSKLRTRLRAGEREATS